jgi:hypothetical protein
MLTTRSSGSVCTQNTKERWRCSAFVRNRRDLPSMGAKKLLDGIKMPVFDVKPFICNTNKITCFFYNELGLTLVGRITHANL